MQRITLTMEDDLAEALEAFVTQSGAGSRSEAIRDLLRQALIGQDRDRRGSDRADADCLAVLSYAIDHGVRDLGRRVPQGRLDRHDQTLTALSVPIDHHSALEVVVMRGATGAVSDYAQSLFSERGILHGALNLVPVVEEHHSHSHGDTGADHVHLKVRETF